MGHKINSEKKKKKKKKTLKHSMKQNLNSVKFPNI